ncbi:RdgB/HAM1 family non-canonical purine NTP pyrophosphatase [Hellea balneolensis]|uniref:RdgB/HAM1 family non-canonical purine NTP pyrophosphatase n=1 Tax=Hellea balneolensis TaxID=287478 RepID=UPI0003F6AB52|nr:RdgB/HAM1 family non-canonical purine NTP pyrophosphatase [Hellea balneolensis]
MKNISKIVVASHNEGKVREIRDLLAPFGIETVSAGELGLAEPDETETTFAGNAELKARAAANASGLPALSDDSGLAVDALNGDPGIYAARWAEKPSCEGGGRDFDMAMWHVNDGIGENPDRRARFICALCLAYPNGEAYTYEGKVEGDIIWPPRGDKGFGYDPIFRAIGDSKTFAEIDPAEKHAKSHRADAFAKFLKDQFPDG